MSCKLLVIFAGLDKIDIVAKIASNMETCNLPLLIVFIYFEYMCTCSFKDHPIAWSVAENALMLQKQTLRLAL